MTSEPEVFSHTLTPKDAFIILASDGVWEFVNSQDAVNIVGAASTAEDGCRQVTLPLDYLRHLLTAFECKQYLKSRAFLFFCKFRMHSHRRKSLEQLVDQKVRKKRFSEQ